MEDGPLVQLPAGWAASQRDDGNNYLRIDPSQLKVGKKLGEGTFGVVYQATWAQIGAPPVEVAVKQLKTLVQLDAMMDFMKELSIMSKLAHPNITKLLGACTKSQAQGGNPVMLMVTELLRRGNLYSVLHVDRRKLKALIYTRSG